MLQQNMKMTAHIDYISKKIAKKIGFLASISRKLTMTSRITIYKSIIAPHFEYCASIVYTCNKEEISRLQKQQNKAMRIILRCKKRTKIEEMLTAIGWMTVNQRITYLTMITIFKIKHGMLPPQICENSSFVSDTHKYPMRNNEDFRIIKNNKVRTNNSIFHKGMKSFNDLPACIKNEKDIKKFKRELCKHVKIHVE